jgi:hypothetical protein
MDNELVFTNGLLLTTLLDQLLSQPIALAGGQHPSHGIAAEDIEDHIKIIVRPFDRSFELGNIPGPDLIRTPGQKLRSGIDGMGKLVSAFSNLSLLLENPIHGPNGTKVGSFVKQRCIDSPGRPVDKAVNVKDVQDLLALFMG